MVVNGVNAPASTSTNCWNGVNPKKFSITEHTPSLTSSLRHNCGLSKINKIIEIIYWTFQIHKFINIVNNCKLVKFTHYKPYGNCICTPCINMKTQKTFNNKFIFSHNWLFRGFTFKYLLKSFFVRIPAAVSDAKILSPPIC